MSTTRIYRSMVGEFRRILLQDPSADQQRVLRWLASHRQHGDWSSSLRQVRRALSRKRPALGGGAGEALEPKPRETRP